MIEFETEVDIKKISLSAKPVVEFGRDTELVDKLSEKSEDLYAEPLQKILSKVKTTSEVAVEKVEAPSSILQSAHTKNNSSNSVSSKQCTTQPSSNTTLTGEYQYISDDDLPEALNDLAKTQVFSQHSRNVLNSSQIEKANFANLQNIEKFELPQEVPSLLDDNSVELTPIDLNELEPSYMKKLTQVVIMLSLYVFLVFCCFYFISDDAIRMISVAAISFSIVTALIVFSTLRTMKKYDTLYKNV